MEKARLVFPDHPVQLSTLPSFLSSACFPARAYVMFSPYRGVLRNQSIIRLYHSLANCWLVCLWRTELAMNRRGAAYTNSDAYLNCAAYITKESSYKIMTVQSQTDAGSCLWWGEDCLGGKEVYMRMTKHDKNHNPPQALNLPLF